MSPKPLPLPPLVCLESVGDIERRKSKLFERRPELDIELSLPCLYRDPADPLRRAPDFRAGCLLENSGCGIIFICLLTLSSESYSDVAGDGGR